MLDVTENSIDEISLIENIEIKIIFIKEQKILSLNHQISSKNSKINETIEHILTFKIFIFSIIYE